MDMKEDITATPIGQIVLEAGGEEYICTSLELHMDINSIPNAKVVIGVGTGLFSTESQNPEKLLREVLDRRNDAYLDMVECKIYEVNDGDETEIFRGIIVSGAVYYKTGNPTYKVITFECLNQACKLFVSPLGSYYNVCGAGVVAYLTDRSVYDNLVLDQTRMRLTYNISEDASNIVNEVLPAIKGKTLDVAAEKILDKIIEAESVFADGSSNRDITHLRAYLFSRYKVNTKLFTDDVEPAFCDGLTRGLLAALRGNSIYNALQTVLLSQEFFLSLIPRWRKHDFKIEIAPSKAWSVDDPIELTGEDITAIEPLYQPLTCLNTPDAFIVHFDCAQELERNQNQGSYMGINGVFSLNPKLMKILKKRFQSGSELSSKEQKMLFKARFYSAPQWLYSAFFNIGVEQTTKQRKAASSKELPELHTTTDDYKEAEELLPKIDKEKIRKLSDDLAKTLFNHIFGAGDTAVVTLLPTHRFKNLENRLGDVVDITFKNPTFFTSSPLNLRGMLTGIVYEYTSGMAGYSRYRIRLSRVRPLDTDEDSIECPLYRER